MHQHAHHHPASGTPDELAVCPVMHMPVNKQAAKDSGLARTVNGKTYYFCCGSCIGMFEQNPDKYTHED
jgi:YHS domain-containing protein